MDGNAPDNSPTLIDFDGSTHRLGESVFSSDSLPRQSSGEVSLTGLDLSVVKKLTVGSGHILNDLCASLWFSYLLLYLENVVGLSSNYAAYLMLLGQIVDAFSTPLIGFEADRSSHCIFFCRNYGRCKSWHLFGTIWVALSFSFVFTPCLGCEGAEDWAKLIYYTPFIVILQTGWAATQISHLALIIKMNPDELVRTEMLAIRYGFTVASNITIFVLAWRSFGVNGGEIDSSDAVHFRNVAFMAVGIGLVFSIIFHLTVRERTDDFVKKCVALRSANDSKPKENSNNDDGNDNDNDTDSRKVLLSNGSQGIDPNSPATADNTGIINEVIRSRKTYSLSTKCLSLGKEHMRAQDWLRIPQFYAVAVIYMMTRLSVNVTQVYVPLYLQKTLKLPAATVATFPLTMYIFGFVVAIFMKPINRLVGRQFSYVLGACLTVAGSVCILVLDLRGGESHLSKYGIYGVAALLGSGASVLFVTSLCITADLIGNNVESGAFVYGAMSFSYKLACGVAVMIINSLVPCQKDDSVNCSASAKEELSIFYKYVLAASSGGCAFIGVGGVILVTLVIFLTRSSQVQLRKTA